MTLPSDSMRKTSNFLPPIPKPPHDPTWVVLNARVGWPQGTDSNVKEIRERQVLALSPQTGSGRSLTESSGSFGGLTVPTNVALGSDGIVYLLDPKTVELKWFDPCECRFKVVPCFGGEGGDARQLRNPHGIGICNGNLFVCDTGIGKNQRNDQKHNSCRDTGGNDIRNQGYRLSVFSLHGFVLRAHWRPPTSVELTKPWEPYGVAFDGKGRVYITDRANRCIHRFSPTGRWEKDGFFTGFGPLTHIAIDYRDRIYVVVEGDEPKVQVIDVDGTRSDAQFRPEEVADWFPRLPFQVDAKGNLHLNELCVGTKGSKNGQELEPPLGIFNVSGQPLSSKPKPLSLRYQKEWEYISEGLDSKLYQCQWHRIILQGTVPQGHKHSSCHLYSRSRPFRWPN